MQHKKIVVAAGLLPSLLFVSAQEVVQTNSQQGDIDPNGSTTCITVDTNLRYKMKDSSVDGDIGNLQDFLIANRYMQGVPTGYFGLGTFNAVKQFQKRNGLNPTGYVGPLTREKIKNISCSSDTQGDTSSRESDILGSNRSSNNDRQAVSQKMTEAFDKMKSTMASSSAVMAKVASLMSEEDKALLKQKEEDLKAKKDTFKTLLDSYGGSTKNLTEDQKASLKAKMEEISVAEKSLMEVRKSVMDKAVNSLSDTERAFIEKMKQTSQNFSGGQKNMQHPVASSTSGNIPPLTPNQREMIR